MIPSKIMNTGIAVVMFLAIIITIAVGIKIATYFHSNEVEDVHTEVTIKYTDIIEEMDKRDTEEYIEWVRNNPPRTVSHCTECNVTIVY